MQGRLSVREADKSSDTWYGTHEIRLEGKVVGTWQPRSEPVPIANIKPRRQPLRLDRYLEQHDIGSLAVLATDTACQDIRSSLIQAGVHQHPSFFRIPFDNADRFLQELDELHLEDVSGLVVARGGGGGWQHTADNPRVVEALMDLELPYTPHWAMPPT